MTDTTTTTTTTATTRPVSFGATTPAARTTRRVGPADIAGVVDTLAAAFRHDPIFAWCIPDPARRVEVLPGFFRLVADAVVPAGESTTLADGQAAALWVPPGTPAVPDPDGFGAAIAQLVGDDAERTFALMAMLDQVHPTDPHWFLWFVGTHPAAQAQGRGSILLQQMSTRSDADGVPIWLDATSERNRALYERHGFEVVARQSVAGSPPMWSMRRTARRARRPITPSM
jgi:ribosomal protein S18 acetylase RimI-like enzyme